jgi:4-hydroxybenzoate polyprenyltransferase
VKNVFVLPGIAVALAADPAQFARLSLPVVLAGLLATGLVASSNYILNEILDAPFDRLHPLRKTRPAAAGLVHLPLAWAQWILFFAAGLALGSVVSPLFVLCLAALWVMGCAYNIPPIRAKDVPFLDVLVEAINNPIRFLLGWYLVPTAAIPIASVLISYWMAGCYFMAIKRYAECRDARSAAVLVQYRRCFKRYNERNLLVSIVFYGLMSMLFFGAYIGRYRLEMALSFPFVALVMVVYFALAFKPDSAAQRPEALLREWPLMTAVILCAAVMAALLFIDIPQLHQWFAPTQFAR